MTRYRRASWLKRLRRGAGRGGRGDARRRRAGGRDRRRRVRAAAELVGDASTLAEAAQERPVHRGRVISYGVLA